MPKGFFLVFPRTEEQLFPSHTDFAKDYAFIINRFDATKKNQSNWYYNRIKNAYAVSGHSMGGGCSMLSIQYSSKITAVFNFAAAETDPSAIAACAAINVPALVFAGGKDCISPPSSNQLPMYNNIQNFCKTYILITNARHCQWSPNSSTCRAGDFFCSPLNVSPKITVSTTFSLLYPWLNDKLNSVASEKARFQSLLTTTAGITYQQNCANNIIANNDTEKSPLKKIKIYPSIIHAGVLMNIAIPALENPATLKIFNQSGNVVFTKSIAVANDQTLNVSTEGFGKGVYFVNITNGSLNYKSNFIVE